MTDPSLIRPADEGDCEFIAGLVPSLLEFGSPAWVDAEALAPGFRDALVGAVCTQGPRSTVLVAEGADELRAGETWARDRGLSALSLDVWSTNERALTFYRRLGYGAESLCLFKRFE